MLEANLQFFDQDRYNHAVVAADCLHLLAEIEEQILGGLIQAVPFEIGALGLLGDCSGTFNIEQVDQSLHGGINTNTTTTTMGINPTFGGENEAAMNDRTIGAFGKTELLLDDGHCLFGVGLGHWRFGSGASLPCITNISPAIIK